MSPTLPPLHSLSSAVVATLLFEAPSRVPAGVVAGVAALATAALLAELQSVRLSSQAEVSVSTLPIVLAAVLYGPLAAICVSAASLLPTLRPPYARWLTWTSTRALAAASAGVTAHLIDPSRSHGICDGRGCRGRGDGGRACCELGPWMRAWQTAWPDSSRASEPGQPRIHRDSTLRAGHGDARLFIPRRLAVERGAVLVPSVGRAEAVPAVSGAAADFAGASECHGKQGESEPFVCRSARSDARCPRSVHGRPFRGGCDICARHRWPARARRPTSNNSLIWLGSSTTLGRLGSRRDCSRR